MLYRIKKSRIIIVMNKRNKTITLLLPHIIGKGPIRIKPPDSILPLDCKRLRRSKKNPRKMKTIPKIARGPIIFIFFFILIYLV